MAPGEPVKNRIQHLLENDCFSDEILRVFPFSEWPDIIQYLKIIDAPTRLGWSYPEEAAFRQAIDFTAVTAALDAAHYPADDPIRRQISDFDFPNILDEHEAGYDRRA